jgi:hypothetical protein
MSKKPKKVGPDVIPVPGGAFVRVDPDPLAVVKLQGLAPSTPFRGDPGAGLVLSGGTTSVEAVDTTPIHAAAEATGLQVTSLAVHEGLVVATCGPHVLPFTGATVAEVVAKIRAYNCKYCGTGGGHNPNCGRP